MRQFKINKSLTNRDALLDRYLQEIGQTELISVLEEVDLAQRIKNGDQVAFEKLVKANLRFVVSVAKQYQNQGLSLPDLINEGNIGLIRAAKKFDETKGFKFISYAVWWIRQSILAAIAEKKRMIRLPINQSADLNKINKARDILEQQLQRTPTSQEIMETIDSNWDKIKYVVASNAPVTSLDQSISFESNGPSTLGETISSDIFSAPDQDIETHYIQKNIVDILSLLSERERFIVRHCFGVDGVDREYSTIEIAEKIGLTKERVRQIKDRALKLLRRTPSVQRMKNK